MSDRSLPQRLTVAQIQAAVCEEFRVPAALFLTTPRGRIARARQVGMYLARELTLHSCKSIGRMFGGRDHATVVWAGNRVTVEMMADPAFAARVTTLEQRLRAPEMVEEF